MTVGLGVVGVAPVDDVVFQDAISHALVSKALSSCWRHGDCGLDPYVEGVVDEERKELTQLPCLAGVVPGWISRHGYISSARTRFKNESGSTPTKDDGIATDDGTSDFLGAKLILL